MTETDKLKAVEDLRNYDHAFISEKGIADFAARFGVKLVGYKHYEDLKHPKGLVLNDGPGVHTDAKGRRYAIGADAQALAMSICDQLGVKYPEYFGRGSQLRGCCDALEAHFKEKSDGGKRSAS